MTQARTVHPYPTLGEAVQQCALNYNRASWAKLGRPDEAGKHMGDERNFWRFQKNVGWLPCVYICIYIYTYVSIYVFM